MQPSGPRDNPADQYKRMRRDALDRLVDRELRRTARCEKTQAVLIRIGLAVLAGVVPAMVAGFSGLIEKIGDFVFSAIHGGPPK